jgi:hypothetical protein
VLLDRSHDDQRLPIVVDHEVLDDYMRTMLLGARNDA